MSNSKWSIKRIRDLIKLKFKKRACLWQIKVALALREHQNDVVAVAPTGAGKTLSFWIGLLMVLEDKEDKLVIVVTPLNLLGKQNVDTLTSAGISAIAIDAKTATDEVFQDVEAHRYQVVVINPEIIMQENGHCEKLWKKTAFTSKILYMVFDEGHCMKEWSTFQEKYKHVGSLRYLIPETVPFYVASATLPSPVLADVSDSLQLHPNHTEYFIHSNDRPDMALSAHKMQHSASSFKDLDFLIPDGFKDGDPPPPKFLIFFDNIKEAEAAIQHLCSRLPDQLRNKIKHFHSVMTSEYRSDEYEALKDSENYGLCVTDSFGMGLDLTDIKVIIQGAGIWGFAILLAEKSYFDDEIAKKEQWNAKRRETASKKRKKRASQATLPAK
ncbi:P-loop containing nucleoside triphosphate hydrolase protein [Sparassis latifolia]